MALRGPSIPIEFARISKGSTPNKELLPLMIYEGVREILILWAILKNEDIGSAIWDLAAREGYKPESIGYIICDTRQSNCRVVHDLKESIFAWALSKRLDAVISGPISHLIFSKEPGMPLTEYNLRNYFRRRRASGNIEAIEYVSNAQAR